MPKLTSSPSRDSQPFLVVSPPSRDARSGQFLRLASGELAGGIGRTGQAPPPKETVKRPIVHTFADLQPPGGRPRIDRGQKPGKSA